MTKEEIKSLGDLKDRQKRFALPLTKRLNQLLSEAKKDPEFEGIAPTDVLNALMTVFATHAAVCRDTAVPVETFTHTMSSEVHKRLRAGCLALDKIEKLGGSLFG